MERMSVVPAELGVGAVERGISRGLGLLDAAESIPSVSQDSQWTTALMAGPYPFRCALRDWLCCDEFFDSVEMSVSRKHCAVRLRKE
jgi:hypothetical protein